jgi:predicted RNA-binding Zn ribbon-like protein
MHDELEKIDLIRNRTGISYREAKKALEEAEGDVVQALINLEEKDRQFSEKMQGRAQDVWDNLKEVLHRGQETKIKVKQGDRTVFEMPATVGAVGILAALASSELAVLGALGTAAAMAKKYTLEIDRGKKGKEPDEKPAGQGGDTFTFKNPSLQ